MSHVSAPSDGAQLSDRVVALLRTAVPTLWGTVVAWALARLAGALPADLADALGSALQSEAAVAVVVLAAVTAWYALWRWLEPYLTQAPWLIRLALGSSRTPIYPPQTPAAETPDVAADTGDETDDEDDGLDPYPYGPGY